MKTFNRNILFRAWDNKTKQWIAKNFHILGEITCFDMISQYCFENKDKNETSLERMLRDVEITQWTGLFDANSNHIYEGDILEFDAKEWGSDEDNKFIVSWNVEDAEWNTGGGTNRECREWKTVIGNVFENVKLTKSIDPTFYVQCC